MDDQDRFIVDCEERTVLHTPPGGKFYIDALWAYISEDERGDEGVLGTTLLNGQMVPMIAADKTRLDQLRPQAESVARMIKRHGLKRKVKLVRFEKRVEVEDING